MGTIIIILIIVLILYFLLNSNAQPQKTSARSEYYPKREIERKPDSSVIDVTRGERRYISPNDLRNYSLGVPYWSHQYVYSYSEIDGANANQKKILSIF